MADTMQHARHPATKRRLQQARRDGDVARSSELAGLAVMAGALGAFAWFTPDAAGGLALMARALWAFDVVAVEAGATVKATVLRGGFALIEVAGPIVLLLFGAAVAGRGSLGGWVWSVKPLSPKLSRLSPVGGMQRLLGANAWLRMAVQAGKTVLLFAAALWLAWTLAPALPALMNGSATDAASELQALITPAGGVLLAVAASVALVDVAMQYWLHRRRLRMTDDQMREEAKQAGTSPQMKQRLRQGRTGRLADDVSTNLSGQAHRAPVLANAVGLVVASAGEGALPTLAVLVRKGEGGGLEVGVVATRLERVRYLVTQVRTAGVPVVAHRGLAMALAHRAAGQAGQSLPASLAEALERLLRVERDHAETAERGDQRAAVRLGQTMAAESRATRIEMEIPKV